jgi:uncharacterized 2Fe-2S/4Fe-4S cluster protein (DUF4445 family)
MLVDFGTNAEIVLFANNMFYACSAAAGPCFEGATLACDMAGQAGAVDKIFADNGDFSFTTIGNIQAKGICGSGVIDALALMLETGLVDSTGRLLPQEETMPWMVKAYDQEKGFCLTDTVYVSQGDIREVQLGKAAVRAGIEVLLEKAGINGESLEYLYLAGGFGSAMNPQSAARIGMIPAQMTAKAKVLGNAACFGALRYVTEQGAPAMAEGIIAQTQYIELSAHQGFFDRYIKHMSFPPLENI